MALKSNEYSGVVVASYDSKSLNAIQQHALRSYDELYMGKILRLGFDMPVSACKLSRYSKGKTIEINKGGSAYVSCMCGLVLEYNHFLVDYGSGYRYKEFCFVVLVGDEHFLVPYETLTGFKAFQLDFLNEKNCEI